MYNKVIANSTSGISIMESIANVDSKASTKTIKDVREVKCFIPECILCSRYEAQDGPTDEAENHEGREGEHH